MEDGSLSGMEGWRAYHETGRLPRSFAEWKGRGTD
jgi:hypothetical protein